jgi:hypothetical protein
MTKFKYFPSFSVGAFGSSLMKDNKLIHKITGEEQSMRFYTKDFPEQYRHNEFLASAGHLYRRPGDYYTDMGFTSDNIIMGDSGGYQICSGAIKWNPAIKEDIFTWLEANSDVAMNLDIPPRITFEGKFQECLEISKENFKYFADRQTGATQFLNVIQGVNEFEFKTWYDEVKQFPFNGWAIGGSGGGFYKLMSGLMVLLEGKEHLKPSTKYIHILGTSRINYFILMLYMQKIFDEMGLDITVTTDSSSPDRSVVFGTYYIGASMKRGTWETINFPNEANHADIVDELVALNNPRWPFVTEFDDWLSQYIDFRDITQSDAEGPYTFSMRLHNFEFFKDIIHRLENVVYGHPYIFEQVVNADTVKLAHSLEEMVKSDNPRQVFEKYKQFYTKINAPQKSSSDLKHNFF